MVGSYGAGLDGFSQRGEGIAGRHELVRHEAGESRVGDGGGDRAPIELLRTVELMAAGHPTRVEMPDECRVVADRPDDVAFHNLHVIDVVQELHARRRHTLHHGDPERGSVTLVAGVIDLAVQELHADRHNRKSTRLNSSHPSISYAVFCLKKKTKHYTMILKSSLLIPPSIF